MNSIGRLPEEDDNDELFSLTQSPYVNELIKACKLLYEETEFPETQENIFEEKLTVMFNFVEQLYNFFLTAQETQIKTSLVEEQNEIIDENIALLKEGLEELNLYLNDHKIKHIVNGIFTVKEATESLFEAFAVLKGEEEKEEVYSQSPYVNDLLRVTEGVICGDFEPHTLRPKLENLLDLWEKSYEQFNILKKIPDVSEEISRRIVRIEDAYEEYGDGLKEMLLYFEDGELKHLEAGSEMVMISSEYLVSSQEFLQDSSEKEKTEAKTCLRCGVKVTPIDKVCANCHQPIPKEETTTTSIMNIQAGDEMGFGDDKRVITLNVKRIIDDVEGFKQGKLSSAELIKTIEWFTEKVCLGKNQYSQLKGNTEQDKEKEQFTEGMELLEKAIDEAEEGLSELRMYFEDNNPSHFTLAVDLIVDASDKVYRLQKLTEEA